MNSSRKYEIPGFASGEVTVKMLAERLEAITNNTPGTVFQYVVHPDGTDRLLYVSKGCEALWGLSQEQCLHDMNQIWDMVRKGGDFEKVVEDVQESMRNLTRWHSKFRIVRPEGTIRYHEGYGNPVRLPDGSTRWDSIVIDITDQHLTINQLMRTKQIARLGSWELDLLIPEQERIYWSPPTHEIMEMDVDATVTLTVALEWVSDEHRELLWGAIDRIRKSGEEFDIEIRVQTGSGRWKWVRLAAQAEFANGRCVKVHGTIQDIDRHKQNEALLNRLNSELQSQAHELYELNAELLAQAKTLKHINSELEQFVYIASHDLQEPLRMITNFMALLDKKYGAHLDEKARQYIFYATDGAIRMRRIILDLLEYSRAGRNQGNIEAVDLNDLFREVLAMHKVVIHESRAEIEVDQLPTIMASRTPMLQVFQNLVGNALRYVAEGVRPKVRITATETSDEWTIHISDNGIGIAVENFEKIFVIFQRLNLNDPRYSGTGLGLAIARKIVDRMGGRIWVESVVGEGSTFHVTIPKRS